MPLVAYRAHRVIRANRYSSTDEIGALILRDIDRPCGTTCARCDRAPFRRSPAHGNSAGTRPHRRSSAWRSLAAPGRARIGTLRPITVEAVGGNCQHATPPGRPSRAPRSLPERLVSAIARRGSHRMALPLWQGNEGRLAAHLGIVEGHPEENAASLDAAAGFPSGPWHRGRRISGIPYPAHHGASALDGELERFARRRLNEP